VPRMSPQNRVGMRPARERRADSRSTNLASTYRRRALPGIALIMFAALLAFAGNASAEPWRPAAQSCVSLTGDGGVCSIARAAQGLWRVVVSPDGRHAYGVAVATRSVLLFDRDPETGALTQKALDGCVSSNANGCDHVRGLHHVYSIVISPDGRNVYTGSAGAIAAFDRDPETGLLTQKTGARGCFTADGSDGARDSGGTPSGCTVVRGMAWDNYAIEISPDGRFVYGGMGSIVALKRDPRTGDLTQLGHVTALPDTAGCVTADGSGGCATARAIGQSRQMSIAPDGRSLYTVGRGVNALVNYDRDPSTGTLQQKGGVAGCIVDEVRVDEVCSLNTRLSAPQAVLVSPDNRHVYVSIKGGVLVFRRGANGGLTPQSCITEALNDGCADGRNLGTASYSAMSPNGQVLVISSVEVPGIAVFVRDADGNLTQPPGAEGCVSRNGAAVTRGISFPGQCGTHRALHNNGHITFLDDNHFIVGTHGGSAAITFRRDFYPRCANVSYTVTQSVAALLPFACHDPDGDALTYSIVSAPLRGSLGAVDQHSASVFYSAFGDVSGDDTLTYSATAAGLPSNVATITMNVVPPPVPAPKPTTVAAEYVFSWAPPTAKRTRLTRATVSDLPSGATIRIYCHGGKPKCKLKSKKPLRAGKSTRMNLLKRDPFNRKAARVFRPGQVLKVRIDAPGRHTQLVRLKFRKSKMPVVTKYCIPLGTKRLQTSC
jgi:hypothetical protein